MKSQTHIYHECHVLKHLAELKGKQEQIKNTNRNTIATCNISNWIELNQEQIALIENTKGTR